MSCDDTLSDISDEADGFFSLDMDVSIDQQLQHHPPTAHTHSAPFSSPSIPLWNARIDASLQSSTREMSASPLAHPAVRRASETAAYSSSPLQGVGLDPIMACRSRNSPALRAVNAVAPTNSTAIAADATASASAGAGAGTGAAGTGNVSSPAAFGPIAPEVDQKGNLEYKLKILPPSRERFDRLVTQLKWRLLEGGGMAMYEIGVLDDGTLIGLDADSMKDSLKLLSLMAAEVGANCHVQRVLALEKMELSNNDAAAEPMTASSSWRRAASESNLSLRALSASQAVEALQPFILASTDLDDDVRTQLMQAGSAGMYRFDIAQQQLPIPPPLVKLDADASATAIGSIAAIDQAEPAPLGDVEMAMSAQTKPRLLKSTLDVLASANDESASTRPKKDILQGRDQSAIVYLPSKEEKRILRAAEAAAEAQHEATMAAANAAKAEAQADRALLHTEAQERKMMAKMTRVADSIQPKTARARARARKSAFVDEATDTSASIPTYPEGASRTPWPATSAVNTPRSLCSTDAYTGYENVMSAFGVLSERAARTLYDVHDDMQAAVGLEARLIVEAVVRQTRIPKTTMSTFSVQGSG